MPVLSSIEKLRHSADRHERLVLADWYEDNHQPMRAELLRGQVALADWLHNQLCYAISLFDQPVRVKQRAILTRCIPTTPVNRIYDWILVCGSGSGRMPVRLECGPGKLCQRFLCKAGEVDSWRVAFAISGIITGMGLRLSEEV